MGFGDDMGGGGVTNGKKDGMERGHVKFLFVKRGRL